MKQFEYILQQKYVAFPILYWMVYRKISGTSILLPSAYVFELLHRMNLQIITCTPS